MSQPADGWSAPSLYAGGEAFAPRTFTEADPLSALLFPDWDEPEVVPDAGVDHAPQWSPTTYVGRHGRRLAPRGAADGAAPEAPPAVPVDEGSPELAEEAGQLEQVGAVDESGKRTLLANSRTIAIASLTSRLTGFARSVLLVAALGSTTEVSIAYNSGNNFPNMVYELLLGGVLSSVLIPLLVHAQAEDDDGGVRYTQRLFSLAVVALAVTTVLAVAASPLIAGAFSPPGPQRDLTTTFAYLLLPEIFFYGLGALFMAVLNIRHSYGPAAWAPVLNNVVVIATIAVFWALPGPATLTPSSMTTSQILVIGIGTTLGIAAQALVLFPALRRVGFHWAWRFRALPNEAGRLREMGTLGLWVLGYVVASQVGVTVIQRIGSYNGGFTVFTYADLLFQMPYGILVVSLLTAIMPRLSRAAVRGDEAAVVADLSLATRLSAVALIPITAGLIVLGPDLGVTLFGHLSSTVAGGRLIGSALAWSAFGLLPFAIVMLQMRVFYAMRDGRTPTLINVFMVGSKVALVLVTNAAFRAPPGTDVNLHPSVRAIEWLNIATSVSYVVGMVIGYVVLTRRLGRLGMRAVAATTVRVAVVSAAAGVAAYLLVTASHHWLGTGHTGSATALVLGGLVGIAVLLVAATRMRITEFHDILTLSRRR
jgi:putative peptidoglycan lipid II flippase